MTSPLTLAFRLLTLGIDAKVEKRHPGERARRAELGQEIMCRIDANPDILFSELLHSFGGDVYKEAVLPSFLTEFSRERLVGMDSSVSTDPRFHLTRSPDRRAPN